MTTVIPSFFARIFRSHAKTRKDFERRRAQILLFTCPLSSADVRCQRAVIEHLLRSWHQDVEFISVDVFDQLEYAAQFGVYDVPTTILLDPHGQVAFVNLDFVNADQLRAQFVQVIIPPELRAPAVTRLTSDTNPQILWREELPCQS